jgi:hypothetical protein
MNKSIDQAEFERRKAEHYAKKKLLKAEPIASSSRLIGCPLWWLKAVLPVVHGPRQLAVALFLYRLRCHSSKSDCAGDQCPTIGGARNRSPHQVSNDQTPGARRVDRRATPQQKDGENYLRTGTQNLKPGVGQN